MSAQIVQFPNVPDTDIVGSLRFLADWLEANPGEATKMVVITATNDDEYLPVAYGYGDIAGKAGIVYLTELAKHALLTYGDLVTNG